jgi:hypothetical protein
MAGLVLDTHWDLHSLQDGDSNARRLLNQLLLYVPPSPVVLSIHSGRNTCFEVDTHREQHKTVSS